LLKYEGFAKKTFVGKKIVPVKIPDTPVKISAGIYYVAMSAATPVGAPITADKLPAIKPVICPARPRRGGRVTPEGGGTPLLDELWGKKIFESLDHVTTAFLNRHHANANMITLKITSPPNDHAISTGVYT
jgi:hypothetical protein